MERYLKKDASARLLITVNLRWFSVVKRHNISNPSSQIFQMEAESMQKRETVERSFTSFATQTDARQSTPEFDGVEAVENPDRVEIDAKNESKASPTKTHHPTSKLQPLQSAVEEEIRRFSLHDTLTFLILWI